jgi:hypothetical protein
MLSVTNIVAPMGQFSALTLLLGAKSSYKVTISGKQRIRNQQRHKTTRNSGTRVASFWKQVHYIQDSL